MTQHWKPWEGAERGRGAERDGENGDVHGHPKRAEDQVMGAAQQRLRQGHPFPARPHDRRREPHRHRPELLPRQQGLPGQGVGRQSQRRHLPRRPRDVRLGGRRQVRLQPEVPVQRHPAAGR